MLISTNLGSVCIVDLRNGWQIISPSKSFSVYAATASEKTEWMAHIEKCAQDLLTKRKMSVRCLIVNASNYVYFHSLCVDLLQEWQHVHFKDLEYSGNYGRLPYCENVLKWWSGGNSTVG